MSFYRGLVVKLICFNDTDIWNVVDIFDFDSQDDSNMNIEFHHKGFIRAVFIPVTEIKNFNSDRTRAVKRHFDLTVGLESWEAV
jgi:hypothetical protein